MAMPPVIGDNNCDDFHLFLQGKVYRGEISISTGVPRSLAGHWEMALETLHCNTTDEFEIEAEELMFIMCAREEHESDFKDVRNRMHSEFHIHTDYSKGLYDQVPFASLLIKKNRDGSFTKTPRGKFTPQAYVDAMNQALRPNDYYFYHGSGVHLLFDKNKPTALELNWNYALLHFKKVIMLPIFGQKSRRLLGMPDLGTMQFTNMINGLTSNMNILLKNNALPRPDTPLLVECNLCEHNGVASNFLHKCKTHYDGHVLNIITRNGGKVSVVYPKEQRKYIPLQSAAFTRVTLNITSAESRIPFNINGIVNAVLHLRPRLKCTAPEPAEARRKTRSDPLLTLSLSEDYKNKTEPEIPEIEFNNNKH